MFKVWCACSAPSGRRPSQLHSVVEGSFFTRLCARMEDSMGFSWGLGLELFSAEYVAAIAPLERRHEKSFTCRSISDSWLFKMRDQSSQTHKQSQKRLSFFFKSPSHTNMLLKNLPRFSCQKNCLSCIASPGPQSPTFHPALPTPPSPHLDRCFPKSPRSMRNQPRLCTFTS